MSDHRTSASGRRAAIRSEIAFRLEAAFTSSGVKGVFATFVLCFASTAVIAAAIRQAFDPRETWLTSLWEALHHLMDISAMGDDGAGALRIWSIFAGATGLAFLAIFTALVLTRFQDTVALYRSGRLSLARVPDLLILGWSDQIPAYVSEAVAGADLSMRRSLRVAILSKRPGESMLQQLEEWKQQGIIQRKVDLSVRSGDPAIPADLDRVRLSEVDSVIVVADAAERNDTHMLRACFAMGRAGFEWKRQRCVLEAVTQAGDLMATELTHSMAVTVNTIEVLALLLAQAMRAHGLSQVVDQLISYRGCEVYFGPVPGDAVSRPFAELIAGVTNASPIGVVADNVLMIRPPMDYDLRADDEVVFLAQTARNLQHSPREARAVLDPQGPTRTHETLTALVIGWNHVAAPCLKQLRGFLADETHIDVVATAPLLSAEERRSLSASEEVNDHVITASIAEYHAVIDTRVRKGAFDVVVVLPYRDHHSPEDADCHTLMAMSLIRAAISDEGLSTRMVVELRMSSSIALADAAAPDDLIVSEALAAALAVQLVDRPLLEPVLADLLDYHGSAFYVRPIGSAISGTQPLVYADLIERSVRCWEIPIGLRIRNEVVLNPDRSLLIDDTVQGVVVVARAPIDSGVDSSLGAVFVRSAIDAVANAAET